MNNLEYYKGSVLFTVITLCLGFAYGYYAYDSIALAIGVVGIMTALGVLETSLSFDNAVANARVLKNMSPLWQHRFLTWGMIIAVFGMRIVFPILIVSITSGISIFAAFSMALNNPQLYADTLTAAHVAIAGFGGAFLFLVAFNYFFDVEKEVHWVKYVEEKLSKLGMIESVAVVFTLLILVGFAMLQPTKDVAWTLLFSGIMGITTHEIVKGIGDLLSADDATTTVAKTGLASFLYLEVLDASFSFDGVIGAFALSSDIFIIMVGLGVGAMYVRSITIHLVSAGTLTQYKYLEHGAHYAIGALALIMFLKMFTHVDELLVGGLGIAFIVISIISSKYSEQD